MSNMLQNTIQQTLLSSLQQFQTQATPAPQETPHDPGNDADVEMEDTSLPRNYRQNKQRTNEDNHFFVRCMLVYCPNTSDFGSGMYSGAWIHAHETTEQQVSVR